MTSANFKVAILMDTKEIQTNPYSMYFGTSNSLDSDHGEVTSFYIRFTDFPRKSLLIQV